MQYVRLAAVVAVSAVGYLVSGQSSTSYHPPDRQVIAAADASETVRPDSIYTGGAPGFVANTTTTNPVVDSVPIANAGPNQTTTLGASVTLTGSGSTNPSGIGTLSYSWQLVSGPAGTQATLSNPQTMSPSFIADVAGQYIVSLTVSNGLSSSSSEVTVSTSNTPPVANAGPNQTVAVGSLAVLDGSASTDLNCDLLNYRWALIEAPSGSAATLSGAATVMPTFAVDRPGTYVARLIVNDGIADSIPSFVAVSTQNSPPVANAGLEQAVNLGASVQLDGTGSTDVDGDALTYRWNLIALPAGSAAVLSNPSAVNPAFTVDVPGSYVAQLIVSDGKVNSIPATVLITTSQTIQPPVAYAGLNQTVQPGSMVRLSETVTDPQGLQPSLRWSLSAKPAGSSAILSGNSIANPTFIADMPGVYVAQLIANNGFFSSTPSTVVISTTNTAPVADPGVSQNVTTGATVTLDGTRSSDSDTDPLTYYWSLLTRPIGSAAVLAAATSASPTFVADVPGTYVAQLIVSDGVLNSNPATVAITAAAVPALTITLDSANVGMNRTINGSVSLNAPAPAGGVAVTLSTSTNGIVVVNPSTVTISPGSTTGAIAVTGVGWGSTNITANSTGYSAASASVTVVNLGAITLPTNVTVGLGQSAPIAVTLPGPAPAGGVVVTLGSGDPSKVTVLPATVTIPAGQTTPPVQPQLTGISLGSTTISVSATGYTSGNQAAVQVTASISFSPQTLTITGSATQNLTLNLSAPAPGTGVTINLTSDTPSVATVPATVAFGPGTSSVNVPVTGVTAGSAVIHASALPSIADTTANVTVGSGGTIALLSSGAVAVGQSTPLSVILSSPAPAPIMVNLISSDPTKLTITPQSVLVPAGSQIPVVAAQMTGVSVGTVAIVASAPNYALSSVPMMVFVGATFVPASLTITGTATANLTLTLSTPAPAGGLTISLSSDTPSVASVPSTVTIAAGATSATVPVTGVTAGSAIIHASDLPSIADTTAAVVVLNPDGTPAAPSGGGSGSGSTSTGTSTGITINNTSVGQNLEASMAIIPPAAAIASPLSVTLTSSDPTKVLLSASAGQAGSGSVVINIPANQGGAPVFAQALASSGSVTVTASATGYPDTTATVTLTPSAFVLVGSQSGSSFTTIEGVTTPLLVEAVQLDSFFNVVGEQFVRGGFSVSVNITSSNPAVGTITNTPIVFNGPDEQTPTQFTPAGSGVTTLTASVPTGFSTPAQGANSLTATVSGEALSGPANAVVGKNLVTGSDSNGNTLQFNLNGQTQSQGTMTITSNNPSLFLLSATPNGAGSASITLTVQAKVFTSPAFYIQGVASSGTGTYTASMAGFGSATGTVTLAPSGFVITVACYELGEAGGVIDFAASVGDAAVCGTAGFGFGISPTMLNSSGNIVNSQQFLASGVSVNLEINNSNSSIVSAPSSVTITGGSTSGQVGLTWVEVNPLTAGSATLSLVQPPGFSTPAQQTQAQATVLGGN